MQVSILQSKVHFSNTIQVSRYSLKEAQIFTLQMKFARLCHNISTYAVSLLAKCKEEQNRAGHNRKYMTKVAAKVENHSVLVLILIGKNTVQFERTESFHEQFTSRKGFLNLEKCQIACRQQVQKDTRLSSKRRGR